MTFWNVFFGVFSGIIAGVVIHLALEFVKRKLAVRKMKLNIKFEINL